MLIGLYAKHTDCLGRFSPQIKDSLGAGAEGSAAAINVEGGAASAHRFDNLVTCIARLGPAYSPPLRGHIYLSLYLSVSQAPPPSTPAPGPPPFHAHIAWYSVDCGSRWHFLCSTAQAHRRH